MFDIIILAVLSTGIVHNAYRVFILREVEQLP